MSQKRSNPWISGYQTNHNYRRDSFGDRVCNDLSEVILQFLPIKDKFRFECVSKKFQRTVYQRHYELYLTEDYHKSVITLEKILQKLPHIKSVKSSIPLNDSEIDLIIKYCNHLNEFDTSLSGISEEFRQLFADRFGSQLTSLRVDLSYKSIIKSMVNIQRIEFRSYGVFNDIMPLIITKNLKKVKLCLHFYSQFKDDFDCLKSVTHLWLRYDNPIDIRFVSQLNQLISLKVVVSHGLVKSVINSLNHLALNCLKLKELNLLKIFEINDLKTEDFMSEIKKFKELKRFSIDCFVPNRYLYPEFEDYFKNAIKTGFQNLTHLTIHFNDLKLSETVLENIAIYLPKLRDLTIYSRIRVKEQTVDFVSRLSKLETLVLNISDNSLSDSFIKSFENKLIENCRKFKRSLIWPTVRKQVLTKGSPKRFDCLSNIIELILYQFCSQISVIVLFVLYITLRNI